MRSFVPLAAAVLLLASPPAGATEYGYVRAGDGGRLQCGAAPPGWREPDLDDKSWALRDTTVDGGTGCAATQFVRWRFDVGPELQRLATTTLRIRYSHGFAAYLNGTEIARRRLDPRADAAALATEYHGPEAERVFVPVRSGLLRPTGNVLAIEVHPRTAGKEPFVDAELIGADGARIVRGPTCSGSASARSRWRSTPTCPPSARCAGGSTRATGGCSPTRRRRPTTRSGSPGSSPAPATITRCRCVPRPPRSPPSTGCR
jgi:hypothetical protein